jgi:tetratricopeptide (TPR) repeat protein
MDKQKAFDYLKRLVKTRDVAKAEEAISEAITKEPKNFRYKFLLVELLLRKKAVEMAERTCKEALNHLPLDKYGLELKGRILLAKRTKKAAKEAIEIFNYLFNQTPSPFLLYWLLRAHLLAKEPKEAWHLLQIVPFEVQDSPYISRLKATILTRLKRYQEAIKIYELLLREKPKDTKLKRQIFTLKKYIKGKDQWEREMQTIARLPSAEQDVNLLLAQADSLKEQRNFLKAIETYQKVLKIDPNNQDANLNLSFCLVRSEKQELMDVGIEKLKYFFLKNPYFHPVRSALFSAYKRRGREQDLLFTLEEALQRHPEKVKICGWIKRYEKLVKANAKDF